MGSFNKIFFRGLITLLPIAVTIYVLYSAIIILDSILGSLLRIILPSSLYFPGSGFFLILLLIYLFGLMLNNFVTEKLVSMVERRLTAVPFIKAIYAPLRDLMNLFSKKDSKQLGTVVLVKLGDSNARILGLMTRSSFEDLALPQAATNSMVAVYCPMSYGLGGYTLLIPKDQVEQINIPVEKAMSLAITGWVSVETPQKRVEL